MKTLHIKAEDIELARDVLVKDGIVAFPTDTVYGLAVRYDHQKAIDHLRYVKQRPEDKPFALMVSSVDMICELAVLNQRDLDLIHLTLPGDVTLVFNKKESINTGYFKEAKTIAFRIPNDTFILNLINATQFGLLVPSANVSGEKVCVNSDEVSFVFENKIEAIVEGVSGQQMASTIIDATQEKLKVLRQGKALLNEIEERLESEYGYRISV